MGASLVSGGCQVCRHLCCRWEREELWAPAWLEGRSHWPNWHCCLVSYGSTAIMASRLKFCMLPFLIFGSLSLWAQLPSPGVQDHRHHLCYSLGSASSGYSSMHTLRCTDMWNSVILLCWTDVCWVRCFTGFRLKWKDKENILLHHYADVIHLEASYLISAIRAFSAIFLLLISSLNLLLSKNMHFMISILLNSECVSWPRNGSILGNILMYVRKICILLLLDEVFYTS